MLSYITRVLRVIARQFKYGSYPISSRRKCNLCGWRGHHFGKLQMAGKPEPIQLCPRCCSFPRHRLAFYLLKGNLGIGHMTLHIGPNKIIENWLRSISVDYLSIDITNYAMRRMDLTNLEIKDSSFSLIWCSHVLEHILDDTKAMAEMFRVLKFDGCAIILVPISGNKTYEDLLVKTPKERLKHFKQEDHVRLYGSDIINRLRSVGFDVKVWDTLRVLSQDIERYGLYYPSETKIFICKKPANSKESSSQ